MAVPMSCMISEASEQTSKAQVKHAGDRGDGHRGGPGGNAPRSVKAWSPRAWMRLKSSPPSMLKTDTEIRSGTVGPLGKPAAIFHPDQPDNARHYGPEFPVPARPWMN